MSTVGAVETALPDRKELAGVRLAYRPDLDGLRGIAALSVVVGHAGWLPSGAFGVDVFFVLSGFLISKIILGSLDRGEFTFADFYARRVKRIFPALITLLIVTWVMALLLFAPGERALVASDVLAGAAFVENIWIYYFPLTERSLAGWQLAHLWTLGIEEQFYLVWPVVLWAIWRFRFRSYVVAAAIVLSFASFSHALLVSSDFNLAWFMPWNRLWELALGSVIAFAQVRIAPPVNSIRSLGNPKIDNLFRFGARHCGLIGGVCLVAALTGLVPASPWARALVSAAGSFLIIAAGSEYWMNRHVLSARPLVFAGLISYPLYLWHAPLFMIADILYVGSSPSSLWQAPVYAKLGVIALSILASYLTYKVIESPIRSAKKTSKVALLLCAVMIMSCAFVIATSNSLSNTTSAWFGGL